MRAWLGTLSIIAMIGCGSSGGDDDGAGTASSGPADASGDMSLGSEAGSVSDGAADDGDDTSAADSSGAGSGTTGEPLPCGDDPSLSANEQMLVDMPADTWMSVPGSDLISVCTPVADMFPGVHLVVGCSAIASAWGGGAWDPSHRKMLVFGGGHADYGGNEVYAFDVASFAWERLTDPTLPPFDQDPLPDGNPVSRHTYSGLQWLDAPQRFMSIGGSMAVGGGGTNVTWLFDVDAAQWTNAAPAEPPPVGYSHSTAYDDATQTVLLRVTQSLWSYDIVANQWNKLMDFGNAPLWPDFERGGDKSGVVDPTRGIFWSFGGDDHLVYDIANAELVHLDWVTTGGGVYDNSTELAGYPEQWFTTGGGDIIHANAPGVDYDSQADAIVAWNGGGPYALDLTTKTWSIMNAEGAPAHPVANGTYGRWRYASAYNVFVLVNAAEENVYFYKHTAGCGEG